MHGWGWMYGRPMCRGRFGRGPLGFARRFVTRQERIEWLEAYLNELRQEARAVEEVLEELKRSAPPATGSAGGA